MLGFTKKQILVLLEKVKMTESQKETVAEIIFHNNQRIEQELEHIIDHILNERDGKFMNDLYH